MKAPDPVGAALAAGWFGRESLTTSPLGAGHINDTYLVVTGEGRYVLQRINQQVFPDPVLLMANVERVLAYLEVAAPGLTAGLCRTVDGAAARCDANGDWWRLWRYVSSDWQLRAPVLPATALAAGAAFGGFQALMRGFPEPPLQPAIKGFLELGHYLDRLEVIVGEQPRLAAQCVDARFIDRHRGLAQQFAPGADYVHGDCKLDNLLFARGGAEVVCVLDLDTVRRGHWAWDFGDLVRSIGTIDGQLSVATFARAAEGFLPAAQVDAAPETLVAAAQYVAFMLGVRFLADHLAGDRYFKVSRRGENLSRCTRQFAMVDTLEKQAAALRAAVADIVDQAAASTRRDEREKL